MIAQLWLDAIDALPMVTYSGDQIGYSAAHITAAVRRSTGRAPVCATPQELAGSKAGTPELLDVFEALYGVFGRADQPYGRVAFGFEERLNEVLNAHRVPVTTGPPGSWRHGVARRRRPRCVTRAADVLRKRVRWRVWR